MTEFNEDYFEELANNTNEFSYASILPPDILPSELEVFFKTSPPSISVLMSEDFVAALSGFFGRNTHWGVVEQYLGQQRITPENKRALRQAVADHIANGQAQTDANPPPALETFTAEGLYHETVPETRWIVQGLLPEGLASLAGRPKQGKSYLALNLAIAVAMGGKALGAYAIPHPGSVLFLALEDNKSRIKRRMHQLMRQVRPWPSDLHFAIFSPRLDNGLVGVLKQWLETHAKPALVVIDMYTKVSPKRKRGSSSNDYDDVYDEMGPVQALADEFHVCILLVMHLNKTVDVEDETSRIMGSTAYAGATVTNLILKRLKDADAADAILSPSGKDLEDTSDIALIFDSGIWTSRGDADVYTQSQQRWEILQVLYALPLGEKATPKYIADALGKKGPATRRLLQKLRDDELVHRNNHDDTYHITHAGVEAMNTREEDSKRKRNLDEFENDPAQDGDSRSRWDNVDPKDFE